MGKDILKKILRDQNHTTKAKKVSLHSLVPNQYIIIDVREPQVFQNTPHMQGALNISSLEKLRIFCQEHQNQSILLVCNGGAQAAEYGSSLVESGLKNIFMLDEYLQIIAEYFPLTYPNQGDL
ncbi:hypothetical protein BBW65_02315 [Helicobacter enhydrae]|uniref:Rhodanese domain-containing protein n=1 Tax=Helicobacter enhydrae TaxID=222136 RepID=A0A1B1U4N6_9HELI|nr:rhodanese-like domain-containing protein [Helicobacter enhydrae]ANV97709.1 hypothetical protein BBW65_02315 [Helicobacter enhydrae]